MNKSLMAMEALQTPEVVATQLSANLQQSMSLAAQFRRQAPSAIMMVGRGTSDHAGMFAKYLFEIELGIPVLLAAPSVGGIYKRTLALTDCLVILISQSGQSPDIVNQAKLAKAGGALCLAIVNDADSPLAKAVDKVLPLHAGPEKAVAATKSYLASLTALGQLTALWSQNHALLTAVSHLPETLKEAQFHPAVISAEEFRGVTNCMVLGRGLGYAIALELALKLKEVLGIHAEAFSSAEFLHGPVTLVAHSLTVLNIVIEDESHAVHQQQMQEIRRRGARVINIDVTTDTHPRMYPLLVMQRCYLDIENVAQSFNLDPDSPPGLKKVTETE
ncbi:glucosamine-6-phosphate deaminase NagB-II [Alteromonas lipolytica]|uniref:Glutamine--fructose-6-phosphate aminotransferase n=1 Tax=Alteromonas lipolytica TaxID=1856405 RepID=A0A1E8FJQ4_9ALTE|nr:SIS domain-containing protein [Alteromonas lipolytica]OFI35848.1 glutamine--fructose-6-phosphate aminotransferase [Alteromonas lipolytica]GGF81365.1 glutamine--fructose-6-phosphate aminotransferase [Alteromonas lipolytica]